MLMFEDSFHPSRRRILFLLAGAVAALPFGAGAEILTKGSFGSREAYLKRVRDLSGLTLSAGASGTLALATR